MRPIEKYGVPTMSMGYLVASAAPIVWRGLMVMKTLQQLLFQVDWSPGLDVLVLDLPPGTGDTQLTLTQTVQLDGAVVISTPQEIALADVRRGVIDMVEDHHAGQMQRLLGERRRRLEILCQALWLALQEVAAAHDGSPFGHPA